MRAARPEPIPASAAAPARRRTAHHRRLWLVVGITFALATTSALVWLHRFAAAVEAPEPRRPPSPLDALSDRRPVTITLTTPSWTKVREVVTVDELHTDHRLWRQMHIGDWDGVESPHRDTALRAMVRSYAGLFRGLPRWRRMTAADWDDVPQPIRAMAYLRMVWHWAGVEEVGLELDMSPAHLAQTIGAIVMAESWFEHRAFNQNPWGSRDLGLAQCSDFCRKEVAAMASRGQILFEPSESDYFNPWIATRVATIWFERELLLSAGDVELAIRAYHRGQAQAMDEKGDAYLTTVLRLRDRYILAKGSSPTWRFLIREISPL